ncbi:MAG: EamA family transporter [Actinobacteria bacterium]|nr:EamA family transporter [Actinomycetota bacterium]
MLYIILSVISYSAVIMLGAYAARLINIVLASAIETIISAIIPTLILIPMMNGKAIQNSRLGILIAIIAGIVIALFTIFLNKAYALNKVAIVAPIVFGGSIFITAILSYIFFKEKISSFQGIGLTILAIGLIFITYARLTGK